MPKPKAQTIQQRFGFLDDDLKKPKHDEIMQWLDANVDRMLPRWLGTQPNWTDEEIAAPIKTAVAGRDAELRKLTQDLEREQAWPDHDPSLNLGHHTPEEQASMNQTYRTVRFSRIHELEDKIARASPAIDAPPPPTKPPIHVLRKQWERPITSGDYIVGFIDFTVYYERPALTLSTEKLDHGWRTKWVISFTSKDEEYRTMRVDFEVKAEIPSLGELIRQINMYRNYGIRRIFVVTPDATHKALLEQQNIGLIQSPPELNALK